MLTGPCFAMVQVRTSKVDCPSHAGQFPSQSKEAEFICETCGHSIHDHASAEIPLIPPSPSAAVSTTYDGITLSLYSISDNIQQTSYSERYIMPTQADSRCTLETDSRSWSCPHSRHPCRWKINDHYATFKSNYFNSRTAVL